jgi:hypothetical protein
MGNRPAPSLPTPKQIRDVHEIIAELYPGARIAKVGPEGITFIYPDAPVISGDQWRGKPFSAEGT